MKNKLIKQLFALSLTLLLALALTACVPEIHIHTGDGSSETAVTNETVSKEETTQKEEAKVESTSESSVNTSIASSEASRVDTNKKEESTASKETSSKSTSSSDNISKSKAKEIALKDAQLKESQIYDYEIELDRDNGVLHYDVSFEYEGRDYDYEINASSGKIISVEKPNVTSSEAKISKSKAKSTALSHAGVKAADISRYEIELEKDDGIWKYEISFNVGYVEYDYTINAENGKILESEKDIDD
ncbi:MAG: PepSY domain-containing protein [Clostridia bacterium]|nr:PepSY domain-containing protein [Clostridia bacterium]